MTKQELDSYFVTNYDKLCNRFGSDSVNEMYIKFERIIRNPEMSQPRDLSKIFGSCVRNYIAVTIRNSKTEKNHCVKYYGMFEDIAVINETGLDTNKVLKALNFLQPMEWKHIKLHYFDGLGFEEIGRQENENGTTVKHNVYRGIRRLRKVLGVE